jgi:hypothetical protein
VNADKGAPELHDVMRAFAGGNHEAVMRMLTPTGPLLADMMREFADKNRSNKVQSREGRTMSALTIARAHPDSISEGRLLTKIWRSPTEKPVTAPFPFRYRFERVEFDGLAGLLAILREIEADISACIIRGELKAGLDPTGWYPRRYKGPDAPLTDVPHDWLMVDLDRGVRTTDDMQQSLMPELRTRAAVLRHSGSSGHPTLNGTYRVHLWFLLDRPLLSVEAKAWVESWNRQNGKQMLDPSIYTPGSVHFTARPVLLQPAVVVDVAEKV